MPFGRRQIETPWFLDDHSAVRKDELALLRAGWMDLEVVPSEIRKDVTPRPRGTENGKHEGTRRAQKPKRTGTDDGQRSLQAGRVGRGVSYMVAGGEHTAQPTDRVLQDRPPEIPAVLPSTVPPGI